MERTPLRIARILLGGLILTLALPAAAQGWGGRRGACDGPQACRALPNLTADQKAAFQKLDDQHKASLEAKRKAVQDAHQAMRTAMRDGKTDLKPLVEKESQARLALMEEHRALRLEREKLLTPEQKKAWDERMAAGQGRGMGQGMGRGRGHGRGGCGQGGCR